jgi:hypothetical protein
MIDLIRDEYDVGLPPMWVVAPVIPSGRIVARALTRHGTFREWFIAHRERQTPGYLSTFAELLFRRPPTAMAHFRGGSPDISLRAAAS